jgi:hypothetical protein
VEQELLTLPEHLSSPPVFSGVRVTRSLVLCVCFVDRCLSFLLAIVKKSCYQIKSGQYFSTYISEADLLGEMNSDIKRPLNKQNILQKIVL